MLTIFFCVMKHYKQTYNRILVIMFFFEKCTETNLLVIKSPLYNLYNINNRYKIYILL